MFYTTAYLTDGVARTKIVEVPFRLEFFFSCSFQNVFYLFKFWSTCSVSACVRATELKKDGTRRRRKNRNSRAKALGVGEHAHKLFSIQEAPSGMQRSCAASVREHVYFWMSGERRGGSAGLPAHTGVLLYLHIC